MTSHVTLSFPRAARLFVGGALAALLAAACAAPTGDGAVSSGEALACDACAGGSLTGDRLLTPVDRTSALRSDWSPSGVAALPAGYVEGATQSLRPDARAAFEAMVDAAARDGVGLRCLSGYRSFQTQCALFASYAANDGCDGANTYSAHAGNSEHQLGTVCDISPAASGSFLTSGSPEDAWLRAHAHEFGFACSYPNTSSADNDGYVNEPWHCRFLGKAAAAALRAREQASGGRLAVPVFVASLTDAERASLEAGADVAPPAAPPPIDAGAAPDCSTVPFEGRCTGAVLEYCQDGVYHRVDCREKTDGRVACGEDPSPFIGNNCVAP